MDKIEAKFQIVTPMFIGGANQQGTPQLSAKAIKSAIMFWWRALNYSQNKTLSELFESERVLFGGSREIKEGETKRANVVSPLMFRVKKSTKKAKTIQNCQYLLGQGMKGREALEGDFTLYVVSKNEIPETAIQAIKAFGLLGGLGARSLKGFGSVSLLEMKRIDTDTQQILYKVPNSKELLIKELQILIGEKRIAGSRIPSLHNCRINVGDTGNKPMGLLTDLNKEFYEYRTNKPSHTRGNFADDAAWLGQMKPPATKIPERTVFGLPHNYYVRSAVNDFLKADVKPSNFERRESPLQFHIQQIGSEDNPEYLYVFVYFKADFLPTAKKNTSLNNIFMKWTDVKPHPVKPQDSVRDIFKVTLPMYGEKKQEEVITKFMDGINVGNNRQQARTASRQLKTENIYDDGKWLATGDSE